jgi:hypothetical protein
MAVTFTASDLANFYGSQNSYFDPMFKHIKYTDGVRFLNHNGAGWLVSDVLVILSMHARVRNQEFVAIKLTKDNKGGCTVVYTDGDDWFLYSQKYCATDFPCNVTMFYRDNVLMLCTEY